MDSSAQQSPSASSPELTGPGSITHLDPQEVRRRLTAQILADVEERHAHAARQEDPRSPRRVLLGLLRNPASLLGLVLLLGFVIVGVMAPVLAPCPPEPRYQNVCGVDHYRVPRYGYGTEPKPPSATERWKWGTTATQYDIYYGVIWGTRTAFKVGLLITSLSLIIGLAVGSVSAYYGGWVDEGIMRVVEIFMAVPFVLAAITFATVLQQVQLHNALPDWLLTLGPDGYTMGDLIPNRMEGVLPAMIALIVFGWTGYARLIRSDILSLKQREFVWAARSLGASDLRIITRHLLPNAIFPVLVLASLEIGTVVLSFAALAFFGLGVPDGYADWGQMISSARDRVPSLVKDWYIVAFPGVAIMLFSLSWNLVGDAVRDLLDPRMASR